MKETATKSKHESRDYDIISVPRRLHMTKSLRALAKMITSKNPKLNCTIYAALATAVEEAIASRKV